jgi:hypothetical protein
MTLASRSAPGQTTISLCPVSNWLDKTAHAYRRLTGGQASVLAPSSGVSATDSANR